jgi:chemotaxis protein methyltransferase CheR
MTDADFAFLRAFLKRRSGLDLGPDKSYLADSRLKPVCRDRGLACLGGLVDRLRSGRDPALEEAVVVAMATHETMFFRDRAPFQALKAQILPRLVASRSAERRLRIWSAAAATGQEAYSIAMILNEMRPALDGWQVDILATDISPLATARAEAGIYSQSEVQRGLPIRQLLAHFTQEGLSWRISQEIRDSVSFRVFNLLEDFTTLGRFDVILCRNLVIYFDLAGKAALLTRMAQALAPDGALCLGASETVLGVTRSLAPDPERSGFFLHSAALPAGAGRRYAAV